MEHHPSFHTYCKRQRSSPAVKTPVQIEKSRQLEFPDQKRSYKKWSKEEKLAMMEFVEEHGIPSANVNKFWEECAHYIFQTTGLVKSGIVSLRNTLYGSWFSQAVIWVFQRYACAEYLSILFRVVNYIVSKGRIYDSLTQMDILQAPCYEDFFIKKFYFFPGCHE